MHILREILLRWKNLTNIFYLIGTEDFGLLIFWRKLTRKLEVPKKSDGIPWSTQKSTNGGPQTKSLPAPILRGLFPKTIFYLKWFWADFPGPFQIEEGVKIN